MILLPKTIIILPVWRKTCNTKKRYITDFTAGFPFYLVCSATPKRMYPHYHREIELTYFYESNGVEYITKGKTYRPERGDLIIANPFEVHECVDYKHTKIACIVVPTFLTDHFNGLTLPHTARSKGIDDIFNQLATLGSAETDNFVKIGKLYELLAILYRDFATKTDESVTKKNAASREIAYTVTSYVNAHLSERLSLSDLAEAVYMSRSSFGHVFKSVTGVAPLDFVESVRLSHARELLAESDLPVTEIAMRCGFTDHSYFTLRFRRATGVTPSEFRKSGQNRTLL